MPFKVRHEGKDILTIDEQVTAIRIQTARGETAVTGIASNEGVVDLIIDRVAPSGPPRLDQVEARQAQDIRDRSKEGDVVGFARDLQVHPEGLKADQGVHDETLREGGVDPNNQQGGVTGPMVDLAQGLSPLDEKARTARVKAFEDHGDANKAIKDNPASEEGFTAEQGATPSDRNESNKRAADRARDNEGAHQTGTAAESKVSAQQPSKPVGVTLPGKVKP